jgi:hypothetical protein
MLSHLHRGLLIAVAGAAVAPAAASAATFCVGAPGCAGTPESTLQAALTAASGATSSANRIELGSGTWVGTNTAGAQPQGLEIVGAGTGLTFLRGTVAGQAALQLTGSAESVTGLTVRLTAQSGADPDGLLLEKGARADGVHVTADPGIVGLPVTIDSGGQLSHAVVDGAGSIGVVIGGPATPDGATISDSEIHGAPAVDVLAAGTTKVLRDRLTVTAASQVGVLDLQGDTIVRDTLVDLRNAPSSVGLAASSINVANAALEARRVTIVGAGGTSTGAEVHSDIVNGAASLSLADSVLQGLGVRVLRDNAGTATVALDHVDTWPAVPDQLNGLVATDVASSYADPLLGADFVPQAGSPLIDAAAPLTDADGTTDAAGAPRSVDGNGDCTAQPDSGAFEAPAAACPPPPGPAPEVVPAKDTSKDTTAPLVTRLRIVHRRAVRFTLSEAAQVTVRIKRAHRTKLVLRRAVHGGSVSLKLKHALRHARYTIRVIAVDGAGNRSVKTAARAKA